MRLAAFLVHDMDGIVADWEHFAATQLPAANGMTALQLQDHAREILLAVAKDLGTPQTLQQQADKSKGLVPIMAGAPETAAQTHAVLRARSGFDINQLVAEYRALRSSVLRRWLAAVSPGASEQEDTIRFNEAIDQAVAESVGHFHSQVERARDLLLGMLGHDMRSPLNTIVHTASHLAHLNAGQEVSTAATRLIRSGASMRALLDDLTDFNRSRLGLGIRVAPVAGDLVRALHDELEQMRGAHPGRQIEASMPAELPGRWDGPRLQQVLRNLVLNAVRHGSPHEAIHVAVRLEESGVVFEVTNAGPRIEPSHLVDMFEPLKMGPASDDKKAQGSGLGLGLFIVREIVKAHGGVVDARSDERQTTFTVRLPRR